MMELNYMGISSWDYETPADHNMRIRNLQAGNIPGDEDRVGKEESAIEPSQYDQIMQIVFCSAFFILLCTLMTLCCCATRRGRPHGVSTAPHHYELSVDQKERKELVNNALVVKHVIKNRKKENDVDKSEKESIEEQGGQIPEDEDVQSSARKRSTSKVEVNEAMHSEYRRTKSNLIISEADRGESICAICLNEYKEQEEICWSHNPDCEHCFHRKCIERWLARHDECPCCRNSYLVSGDVEGALAQQSRDILLNSSSSRDIPRGDRAWYDIALDYSGAVREEVNFR